MTNSERDTKFLLIAIELSKKGMESGSGGPFGCIVVKGDIVVGEGNNQVTSSNDPTAHAEVVAIRNACSNLGTYQLDGCEIFTSCEPCPMCLGAIYWARPARVVYANTREEDKKILTLTLNPFSNSARVECDKEKRVFLIRKEGFRRNKIVVRNEYGVKVGELGQENKEHFIDVNNERFFYSVQNLPEEKLIIYKDSKENPFLSCMLSSQDGNTSIEIKKTKQFSATTHSGLLMALCWYMFLPVSKELPKEQTIPV